jgi:hypothetical protein
VRKITPGNDVAISWRECPFRRLLRYVEPVQGQSLADSRYLRQLQKTFELGLADSSGSSSHGTTKWLFIELISTSYLKPKLATSVVCVNGPHANTTRIQRIDRDYGCALRFLYQNFPGLPPGPREIVEALVRIILRSSAMQPGLDPKDFACTGRGPAM